MALRRFAQQNNAGASPRSPDVRALASPLNTPSTPKTRLSYGIHRSPADTPSISSSVPFDWEAARSRAPPPYATPLRGKKSIATGTQATQTRKAIIRKKSLFEKIKSLPSTIAFEIALFPHNVPLPTPKMSARILGGSIHVLHFLILANRDSEEGWDRVSGVRRTSFFDWTTPITLILIFSSVLNTYYMCTRTKNYKFHRRSDPIASPHAKYVTTTLDLDPLEQPTTGQRIRSNLWYSFSYSWRFLFGLWPPKQPLSLREKTSKVLEMDIWDPSEMEMELFSIYSPAHALLWLAMGSLNWLMSVLIMAVVGIQLNTLTHSYTQLLKDKQILSSETMKEYNDIFVNPRLNPIRHDVAVMTHQSEVVNVWED